MCIFRITPVFAATYFEQEAQQLAISIFIYLIGKYILTKLFIWDIIYLPHR